MLIGQAGSAASVRQGRRMMVNTVEVSSVRYLLLGVVMVVSAAAPAGAQTEGRFSIGGSVTATLATDDEVGSAWSIGAIARVNPRRGWGAAGAFNWLQARLDRSSDGLRRVRAAADQATMAAWPDTVGHRPAARRAFDRRRTVVQPGRIRQRLPVAASRQSTPTTASRSGRASPDLHPGAARRADRPRRLLTNRPGIVYRRQRGHGVHGPLEGGCRGVEHRRGVRRF